MKAPDKIIVSPHEIFDYDLDIQEVGHNGAEEYIRKETLLEWAKEQWLHTRNGTMADQIRSSAYEEMIKHLEQL